MNVLILGGDGYLGWATAMDMAAAGHEVTVADNYLRRTLAEQTDSEALISVPNLSDRARVFESLSGKAVQVRIGDCADWEFMSSLVKDAKPDVLIHYAEQPSAPYSMRGYPEARLTLDNNLQATFNTIWAVMEFAPECHIVKLGTMGEYGTPNIDIEEGWLEVEHKGRSQKFLYPRAAGSLYHTTKVLDTDLLWFYVRTMGVRVTDLMQGPVYGLSTVEGDLDNALLPHFHYDDIFGTVVNRFLVQAVAGVPLTVYGEGGQTRGYLNIRDTMKCVRLASESTPEPGELRIFNQFTETFSVNEIASRVKTAGAELGLDVDVQTVPNPRKELEDHYYNPAHTGLVELGLEPTLMSTEVLVAMLKLIMDNQDRIDESKILPRVKWN